VGQRQEDSILPKFVRRKFDLLLQQGQIKLSQFHTIPSAEELKRMKYCKWHNATSHGNDCKIFSQQIQSAIEQGKLKFETPTKAVKLMKIDHPFPTNTVEVSIKDTSHVKPLTSESAQNKGFVDPKVQETVVDVKGKGLLLEEGDIKLRQPVTSEMLIEKFQHRQEKARGREEWAQCNEGH
jgi:hypothetical protein